MMRINKGFGAVALLLVLVISLGACTTTSGAGALAEEDEAAIYAAVIRQIYEKDDSFGGTFQAPTLYVVRRTNDAAGDPGAQRSESALLSEAVQAEITKALADLPTEIIWVDAFEDVELDPERGSVPGNGAIITLGNLNEQEDGSVQVAGSIYVANLAAAGQTYVLEQVDGEWTITGTTGVQWIS